MLSFDEYARLDGTALAELIRRRDVSAAEVRAVAIAEIERFNPRLNAVLEVLRDSSAADIAALRPDAPFAGVPFMIKELSLHARGAPCRMGSRLAANVSFPTDTELMARFRRAGLVTIGTTQTPEFGYCGTTEPVAFGPAHNPWRLGYSPGGSSGGSGAAVGARIVPIAHANDGGGSIRIPASSNGLVGLKPTRDRTPSGPDVSDPLFGHAIEFVVTRSVRDAAAMLDAVAGPDVGAPANVAPVEGSFLEQSKRAPRRLRIACMTQSPFGAPLHPECAESMRRTRAGAGTRIDRREPFVRLGQVHATRACHLVCRNRCGNRGSRAVDGSNAIARQPRVGNACVLRSRSADVRLRRLRSDGLFQCRISESRGLLSGHRRVAFANLWTTTAAARCRRSECQRHRCDDVDTADVRVVSVYADLQRNRPTGDLVAAALVYRGAADGQPVRWPVR